MTNSAYLMEGDYWEIGFPDDDDDIYIEFDGSVGCDSTWGYFYVNGQELYNRLKEFYGDN